MESNPTSVRTVFLLAGFLVFNTSPESNKTPFVPCSAAAQAAERTPGRVLTIVRQIHDPVLTVESPGAEGNKYGFEGGRVLKLEGKYHLFTSEMVGDPFWVRMKLAHWVSSDRLHWKRVSTLLTSSGDFTGQDRRAALWAPMPVFDATKDFWNLFYVAYRAQPDTKTKFLGNYEGRIWRAISTVKGITGIDGPYKDMGVVLEPGKDSDSWEGLQGTDSFFPYLVGIRWYGFYGSAHTEAKPIKSWQVGLASADSLAGPWKRLSQINPLQIEKLFVENPVVTKLKDQTYAAVYDTDVNFPDAIGYAFSTDGIHWSAGQHLVIPPVAQRGWPHRLRTPLGLVPEGNDEFSLFYTAYDLPRNGGSGKEPPKGSVGLVSVRMHSPDRNRAQ
jgi:hypothetical protein